VLLARRQSLFRGCASRQQGFCPRAAHLRAPAFDFETRIATVDVATAIGELTVASIYVPNGGKDFPAKMAFLAAMDALAASYQSSGRLLAFLGDMNVARTERDVHPKERKPRAIGQLPEERALIERILSRGLVTSAARSIPTTTACSRGGRRGAICGSATSAGGSIMCSPARRSPRGPRSVR